MKKITILCLLSLFSIKLLAQNKDFTYLTNYWLPGYSAVRKCLPIKESLYKSNGVKIQETNPIDLETFTKRLTNNQLKEIETKSKKILYNTINEYEMGLIELTQKQKNSKIIIRKNQHKLGYEFGTELIVTNRFNKTVKSLEIELTSYHSKQSYNNVDRTLPTSFIKKMNYDGKIKTITKEIKDTIQYGKSINIKLDSYGLNDLRPNSPKIQRIEITGIKITYSDKSKTIIENTEEVIETENLEIELNRLKERLNNIEKNVIYELYKLYLFNFNENLDKYNNSKEKKIKDALRDSLDQILKQTLLKYIDTSVRKDLKRVQYSYSKTIKNINALQTLYKLNKNQKNEILNKYKIDIDRLQPHIKNILDTIHKYNTTLDTISTYTLVYGIQPTKSLFYTIDSTHILINNPLSGIIIHNSKLEKIEMSIYNYEKENLTDTNRFYYWNVYPEIILDRLTLNNEVIIKEPKQKTKRFIPIIPISIGTLFIVFATLITQI